ncbi:putative helicase with zinc finger domain isoform X3 [Arapaima gigas]
MAERKAETLCARAREHLRGRDYRRAVRCCDEVLGAARDSRCSSASGRSCSGSRSRLEPSVLIQALLCRVSALVQLAVGYSVTGVDVPLSCAVLSLQGELGEGPLRDLLVSLMLNGQLEDMCQLLLNCQPVEWAVMFVMFIGIYFYLLVEPLWKYRDPPRGVLEAEEYSICLRYLQSGICALGRFCVSAHSHWELLEWKERLVFHRLQRFEARRAKVPADCFGKDLREKCLNNCLPHAVVASSVAGVIVVCVPDLHQLIKKKHFSLRWTLHLHCNPPRVLYHVSLLSELHRSCFSIIGVAAGDPDKLCPYSLSKPLCDWSISQQDHRPKRVYEVTLLFSTHTYGSFHQTVLFDFGSEPVLFQTVKAELAATQDPELDQQPEGTQPSMHWDSGCKQVAVVDFLPCDQSQLDQSLLHSYQIPAAADQLFTRSVLDRHLTPYNYHSRLHDLLYIEENAQYKELSRFHLKTCLHLSTEPSMPGLQSTVKPLLPGQLFAQMNLPVSGVQLDTAVGWLVRNTVGSVLFLPAVTPPDGSGAVSSAGRERVYEACVEVWAPEDMLLRLSEECCRDLKLQPDLNLEVELQFQLNRLPLCEMHYAVDSLHDCSLVFPAPLFAELSPCPQSAEGQDVRLDEQQSKAFRAITATRSLQLPPVLLCGPPGSGKTFTLLRAVGVLLRENINRYMFQSSFLLFTRHCSTTSHSALDISLLGREEVKKSRVVVSTLRQVKHLINLKLDTGHFTHILIDEASSSPECETIMALALANRTTRVVLAGDIHQLPPLMHSEFACERELQRPLLARLCMLYPQGNSFWVQLSKQYRTQQHIVSLVSDVFYGGKLRAGSKQPMHKDFFPLSFFVAWGTERSACGYYNHAEVLEVADQVEGLCRKWPVSWGKLEEASVGVLTPYPSQALRLRLELQQRGLHCVIVQTLITPPARHFRVVFLSTVRTHQSCRASTYSHGGGTTGIQRRLSAQGDSETVEDRALGFLSSVRSLHCAFLSTQSLLAVVGDPVALCTMGKCRRIWQHFLSLCASQGGLCGATLPELLEQMDTVEMSHGCILNPLAPEFVPRTPPSLTPAWRPSTPPPRVMVKQSPLQHFKPPITRDNFGPAAGHYIPEGGAPYFLPVSSGHSCMYRKSPSPPSPTDPFFKGSLAPCSRYSRRMHANSQMMAYNLSLVQSPKVLPSSVPQHPRVSARSFKNRSDSALTFRRRGMEELYPSLEALHLWGGAGNMDQAGHSPLPCDLEQTSTPDSCGSQASSSPSPPVFFLKNYPSLFRGSLRPDCPLHFELAGKNLSLGSNQWACPSSAHNGSHVSMRERLSGEFGPSRYSLWAHETRELGSQLPCPHSTQSLVYTPRKMPQPALLTRVVGSLATPKFGSPAARRDVKNPKKLFQHWIPPSHTPSPSSSMLTITESSQQLDDTETSPSSPVHRLPLDQDRDPFPLLSQVPRKNYSPSELDAVEHVVEEATCGRRLYQRGQSLLSPPEKFPLSQTSRALDSTNTPSPVLNLVWDTEGHQEGIEQEKAATSSSCEPGELQTCATSCLGPPASATDPLTLLQGLGLSCDSDNRPSYSYFP